MIVRPLCPQNAFTAAVAVCIGFCISPVAAQEDSLTNGGADRVVSVGRLMRSGEARNGAPRYALHDTRGALTAYVVPAFGVNLAEYVNQSVVITARNVSRDPLGVPYLMAQHVTPRGVVRPGATGVDGDPAAEAGGAGDDPETLDEPRLIAQWEDESEVQFEELAGSDEGWDVPPSLPVAPEAEPLNVMRDDSVQAADYVTDETFAEPAEILPLAEGDEGYEPFPQSLTTGCADPNCAHCTPSGPCTTNCCPCGPAGRFWFRTEYLAWWTKSFDTPPLVTTSPLDTPAQDAGVLGVGGTEILAGGTNSDSQSRSGVRFLLGGWIDARQHRGWEVDYFFLDDESDGFSLGSLGDPILARPFFNTQLNLQDAELVAFPGIVTGTVHVAQHSEFQSFAPRFRQNLRCNDFFSLACGGCGTCDACTSGMTGPIGGSRVDVSLGYRYMRLNERLRISEDLISEAESTFAAFNLFDAFETSNELHGFEIGLLWDVYRGPWSMEIASRFAMGNNTRRVAINGGTRSVIQGAAFEDVGGLLALPSNIGTYEDDEFVVIPELSLTFGYQLAPQVRFLVGYTFIYWNNVVRPGDQIDLNVNPDLLPPALGADGLVAPAFVMNDDSFWAQGINLGLDWRW